MRFASLPGPVGVRLKIRANRVWTWAASALVDGASFVVLASGLPLEAAQAGSFAIASAAALAVIRRGGAHLRVVPGLVVLASAYCLRAGVLSLGAFEWGWTAQLAIVPAALVGALTSWLGMPFMIERFPRSLSPSAVSLRSTAILVVAYLVALRLVYLGQLELLPQEAYYWNYAQHLDIGYLDHPPLVAWLIAAATPVFASEFFVRLPAFACWLVMAFYAVRYTRDTAGEDAAFRAALLVAVLPFFFLTGVLMTPDAPLAAAWAAALYFLARALLTGAERAWLGAGVAIGIGMLSKYSMVLVPLAVLVFVLIDAESRRVLVSPWAWAGAALALVLFAPVIVWNVHNDWASFSFQGARRLVGQARRFDLPALTGFVLLLLTPWGVLAFARAVGRSRAALRHSKLDAAGAPVGRANRFVLVFTLVPLAVFAGTSVYSPTKVHWTGPIWLAALPAIAAGFALPRPADRRWVDCHLALSFRHLVHTLMLVWAIGLFYYPVYGLAGIRDHHYYLKMGWRDLRAQVQAVEDEVLVETGNRPAIVGLDKHNTADAMAYYDPDLDGAQQTTSRHLFFDEDAVMYERWSPRQRYAGRDLIAVSDRRSDLEDPRIARHAGRLGPIRTITVRRRDVPVARYYVRVVYGYDPAGRPP